MISKEMKAERRYDIDWVRVIAIWLLLIYHIAIVFQPWAMFIAFIQSNELLEWLWKPMTLLNVWRIPLLFFVSGMGVYFAIRKRNWKQVLLERGKRILIPFLFGIVAIAPLHMLLFQNYYKLPLNYFSHQGHLWFLGNIFAYVLILLPLFLYFKRNKNSLFILKFEKLMSFGIGPLLVSIPFIIEVLVIKPQLFALYAQTWHGFFIGLLAFFFGFMFMACGARFWNTIKTWKWLYLAIAIILFCVRYFMFSTESPGYLTAIESNAWILTVFGFAYHYLNKPSKVLNYFSKAAYPIYIIHMFALYLGAILILPLKISAILKFFLIVLFTTVFCYAFYEFVISKITFLKPLFGLKVEFNKTKKRKIIESVSN